MISIDELEMLKTLILNCSNSQLDEISFYVEDEQLSRTITELKGERNDL